MKKIKKFTLIAILLLLVITGASSIVITRENEYSLIWQFGKIDYVVFTPGLSF